MNTIPSYPFLLVAMTISLSATSIAQMPQATPTVLVQKAKQVEEKLSRNYIGRTEAIDSINIQPRVSGNILQQKFSEGDLVAKDQLLYKIEDTQYKANVQTAQAKIAEIKARLEYATNAHKRYSNLAKTNSVSKDTAENTQSAVHALEAEMISAQAALTIAEDDLNYTEIKSPIAGRIGRVSQSAGNYITPQSPALVTVTRLDEVYVRFPISGRDFLSIFGSSEKLKQDGAVTITFPNGQPMGSSTEIAFIDNKIQPNTDTLNVWIKVNNEEETLHPGSPVTVNLSKKQHDKTCAIDISAVMHDESSSFVYVLNQDNKVERRNVKLGQLTGNKQSIREGINPNDTVIIDGMHKVRPDMAVMPVETH